MSLCCTRRNDAHKGAFVQSSVLRWVLGDLHFNGSLLSTTFSYHREPLRYHIRGKDTVVRVSVYEDRTTRKNLTVVTFDHCLRAILFFNGNVSLTDQRPLHQPSPSA